MQNTLRPAQVTNAAIALLDAAYAKKRTIAGTDLLGITSYRQTNLLLAHNLKNKWTEEANRLRSPYFDYEQKDVADALRRMLNTLSQHISIERADLVPLLQEAILETATLIDSPAAAITRMAEPLAKPAIKLTELQALAKYVTVHGDMLQALLKELASLGAAEVLKGDLQRQLKQLEDRLPANIKQRLYKEFTDALGIVEEVSVELEPPQPQKQAEPTEPENFFEALTLVEEEPLTPASVAPEDAPQLVADPDQPKVVADIYVEATQPAHTQQQLVEPVVFELAPIVESKTVEPSPASKPKDHPQPASKLSGLHLTDTLVERLGTTPGDDALYHKISAGAGPLRNAIPIGERYMLVNSLFRGDNLAYLASLDRLDTAHGQAEALDILRNAMTDQYKWDTDSDAYKALETVVKRKFAA